MCVYVYVCVRARLCVCVCVSVRSCVHRRGDLNGAISNQLLHHSVHSRRPFATLTTLAALRRLLRARIRAVVHG